MLFFGRYTHIYIYIGIYLYTYKCVDTLYMCSYIQYVHIHIHIKVVRPWGLWLEVKFNMELSAGTILAWWYHDPPIPKIPNETEFFVWLVRIVVGFVGCFTRRYTEYLRIPHFFGYHHCIPVFQRQLANLRDQKSRVATAPFFFVHSYSMSTLLHVSVHVSNSIRKHHDWLRRYRWKYGNGRTRNAMQRLVYIQVC